MNALQIEEGLRGVLGDRVNFLGCYPQNDFLKVIQDAKKLLKPSVFILNTLNREDTAIMGHWIAVFIDYETLTIGYYDSYNLHPSLNSRALHSFIQSSPYMNVSTLAYRLQGIQTTVCGLYVMYISYLLTHYTLKRALQSIHATFKKGQYFYNDKLITRMGYKLFHMPNCERTFCHRENMKQCKRNICDVE